MGVNIYNDEEKQFSKLISDLKELPKVDAPDNFEFQLNMRIQKKSFDILPEPREQFNLIKFFAPSAVVVTVFILLFVFLPNDEQYDNPLMTDPPQIVTQADPNKSLQDKNSDKIERSKNNSRSKSSSAALNVKVNPNDAVVKPNSKYPIFNNRSVALDDYISGENRRRNNLQGNIVKGGDDVSEFDGFFTREEADKNTILKYRALLDSIKKAQAKQDSLKRMKKAE
ncbi:MAG: hypothetical protein AB1432_02840 [Bacteroidota bacterium]|jgi:hypothetical protein